MGNSMAQEIAEENGLKDIDHKPNVWTAHERSIAKAEKKRAKELEDALKAEKQAQATANFTEEVQTSNQVAASETEESDIITAETDNAEETQAEDVQTEEATVEADDNMEATEKSSHYINEEDSAPSAFA
jgi:hypothetical protein